MTKVRDVIQRFELFAPKEMAEHGDPIGLQLGSLDADVHRMLISLDVRPEVVAEAIRENVDFIFAHHPAMFHPVKSFDLSVPQNAMYAELLKHNITVYAAHTNLDNANGGMNDWLAAALKLDSTRPLLQIHELPLLKLAVFVPKSAAESMRKALGEAGAGQIGEYQQCSFSSIGQGRFTPSAQAHPVIGKSLRPEQVTGEKIEVTLPYRLKDKVLTAMLSAHPYEKPVFDLFTVGGLGEKYGMGRVGELKQKMTIIEFAEFCKQVFSVPHLRVISKDLQQKVKKVAILGGSGGQFYPEALKSGAQVYITGDISYHTGHDILANGLSVFDPGHHIEQICKTRLKQKFDVWNKEEDWQIETVSSKLNTDPFKFI
ncbi:Nif3-like dinuclear metal center hexameric protein [Liquorilactobacillus oeni]|uniref:GTP cyclohydrolase 1 type 2 homolog n=1 Tax=Liquorilactobacillus oeni DSM 19972 TaxID=1423777 RepID=A0A0R1MGL3_9LACO|nr:Nif3-like dinuclear metal center hexameric protein [Liquorilactobacillus oeni]KRL04322.1 hypothetical protein FD46_GL001447 [Liquorilactobacillus oeni DSM 19972]